MLFDGRDDDGKSEQDTGIGMAGHAVALREALHDKKDLPFTAAEHALLAEWLKQLADQAPRGAQD